MRWRAPVLHGLSDLSILAGTCGILWGVRELFGLDVAAIVAGGALIFAGVRLGLRAAAEDQGG